MPSWSEIIKETDERSNQLEFINDKRSFFLKSISEHTGRNVIAYYSSFLTKSTYSDIDINDSDKNAFMQAVYSMDKSKGLDLILHTPGGGIAATESIVDYLKSIFDGNIRAIVPQMAMSAGTMIALSCSSIMMGKQSSLGPIDPQSRGISCQESLDEFNTAKREVKEDISCLGLWQVIISRYTPTFLMACNNAIDLSKELARNWINNNNNIKEENREKIINLFVEHSNSKTHDRHISKDKCIEIGLNIIEMEEDHKLQDLILSLHHCYMIFFDKTLALKIVENQIGARYIKISNEKPQA